MVAGSVFISWSGVTALKIAIALKSLLTVCVDEPVFVSEEDIQGGSRALAVLADRLDEAEYGIAIITAENATAPWLLFEVGALGRAVGRPGSSDLVVPLLAGITLDYIDLKNPLTQFQFRVADSRRDIFAVAQEIATIRGKPSTPTLEERFASAWPKYDASLQAALAEGPPAARSMNELVGDIHVAVRDLAVRVRRQAEELTLLTALNGGRRGWAGDAEHLVVPESWTARQVARVRRILEEDGFAEAQANDVRVRLREDRGAYFVTVMVGFAGRDYRADSRREFELTKLQVETDFARLLSKLVDEFIGPVKLIVGLDNDRVWEGESGPVAEIRSELSGGLEG